MVKCPQFSLDLRVKGLPTINADGLIARCWGLNLICRLKLIRGGLNLVCGGFNLIFGGFNLIFVGVEPYMWGLMRAALT